MPYWYESFWLPLLIMWKDLRVHWIFKDLHIAVLKHCGVIILTADVVISTVGDRAFPLF